AGINDNRYPLNYHRSVAKRPDRFCEDQSRLGNSFDFRLTSLLLIVPSNHLYGLFSVPAPLFDLLAGSSAGFFMSLAPHLLRFLRHGLDAVLMRTHRVPPFPQPALSSLAGLSNIPADTNSFVVERTKGHEAAFANAGTVAGARRNVVGTRQASFLP